MGTARLYVAGDSSVTVISRRRPQMAGARTVRRSWDGVVELASQSLAPQERASPAEAAMVLVPPAVLAAVLLPLGVDPLVAVGSSSVTLLVTACLGPVVRRHLPRHGAAAPARPQQCHLLFDDEERVRFRAALEQADRVAETLPELGGLVDEATGHRMLVEALWDLAGVLSRRQEVRRVLTELEQQDHVDVQSASRAVRDLLAQRHKARSLLAALDADVERRVGNLRRAEQAGRGFLREREIRRTVREAARFLDDAPEHGGPAVPDAGEDLAEQTATVLAAYHELTARHGDDLDG